MAPNSEERKAQLQYKLVKIKEQFLKDYNLNESIEHADTAYKKSLERCLEKKEDNNATPNEKEIFRIYSDEFFNILCDNKLKDNLDKFSSDDNDKQNLELAYNQVLEKLITKYSKNHKINESSEFYYQTLFIEYIDFLFEKRLSKTRSQFKYNGNFRCNPEVLHLACYNTARELYKNYKSEKKKTLIYFIYKILNKNFSPNIYNKLNSNYFKLVKKICSRGRRFNLWLKRWKPILELINIVIVALLFGILGIIISYRSMIAELRSKEIAQKQYEDIQRNKKSEIIAIVGTDGDLRELIDSFEKGSSSWREKRGNYEDRYWENIKNGLYVALVNLSEDTLTIEEYDIEVTFQKKQEGEEKTYSEEKTYKRKFIPHLDSKERQLKPGKAKGPMRLDWDKFKHNSKEFEINKLKDNDIVCIRFPNIKK